MVGAGTPGRRSGRREDGRAPGTHGQGVVRQVHGRLFQGAQQAQHAARLPADPRSAAQTCGRSRAATRLHRRRAADARSDSEGQRRKARQKDAAPGRDDDFRVRPSAPKNRGKGQGQSFVSKVLKQTGKASGGKSSMRHSAAGGNGARAAQRPGSRLGRGHTTAQAATANRAGPTGRRPPKPTSMPSRSGPPTTGTISASSSRPRTGPSWTTCAPTPGIW